jgi:hypothetical protein
MRVPLAKGKERTTNRPSHATALFNRVAFTVTGTGFANGAATRLETGATTEGWHAMSVQAQPKRRRVENLLCIEASLTLGALSNWHFIEFAATGKTYAGHSGHLANLARFAKMRRGIPSNLRR